MSKPDTNSVVLALEHIADPMSWKLTDVIPRIAVEALPLAKSMVEKLEHYDELVDAYDREKNAHAELQARCYEGYPSVSDGIFDYLKSIEDQRIGLEWIIKNFGITLRGMMKLAGKNSYKDCPAILWSMLEDK